MGDQEIVTAVASNNKRSSSSKTIKRRNGTNGSIGSKGPPKKRGRPSSCHPSQSCGPCSIWLQTGRDPRVAQQHVSLPMRHPGPNAEAMSAYVSLQGVYTCITLQHDSCVCDGCYRDFSRNVNLNNGVIPCWRKLLDDFDKHCIMCCTNNQCSCSRVEEWAPSTWHGSQSIEWWRTYFNHTLKCVLS